ncbi:MAG: hypothetical protein MUD10_00770 [Candidatus Pacebacteria bacterium]|nr:hypothetical protein [Candidatus Paceibacterota bacterium]
MAEFNPELCSRILRELLGDNLAVSDKAGLEGELAEQVKAMPKEAKQKYLELKIKGTPQELAEMLPYLLADPPTMTGEERQLQSKRMQDMQLRKDLVNPRSSLVAIEFAFEHGVAGTMERLKELLKAIPAKERGGLKPDPKSLGRSREELNKLMKRGVTKEEAMDKLPPTMGLDILLGKSFAKLGDSAAEKKRG